MLVTEITKCLFLIQQINIYMGLGKNTISEQTEEIKWKKILQKSIEDSVSAGTSII